MAENYDVIIIGVGPNGMTIGGYLAKAGLKVLMLEKRHEVGGGLATEEVTLPFYLHNTHAVYHLMAEYAPPLKDFNIEQYAVKMIYPDLQFALPLSDGRCVCLYRDVNKTCESIAKFSQRDAESYREAYHNFHEMVDSFLAPATYAPPMPAPLQAAQLEQTELGSKITAISEETPEDIVNELFENEHVRALMLYVACHWGLDYSQSGVSYLVPLTIERATTYGLVEGGSHKLSAALLKAVLENKGEVRTSVRIKRIMVENGEAKGVELIDGTEIRANKAVVSTIDTHQTFLKLEIPSIYNSADLIVAGFSSFILGSSLIYLLFIDRNSQFHTKTSSIKEKWEKLLEEIPNEDEKRIVRIIIDEAGTIFQSQIVEKSGFSKSKVSLILDRLEAKRILERKRRGMTNAVVLK